MGEYKCMQKSHGGYHVKGPGVSVVVWHHPETLMDMCDRAHAAGQSAATEAHVERYDEAIRRAETAERERDTERSFLAEVRATRDKAMDKLAAYRKILDAIACAVHGWEPGSRKTYLADQLADQVRELRERADSKVSDGSWRERAEKAERQRGEVRSGYRKLLSEARNEAMRLQVRIENIDSEWAKKLEAVESHNESLLSDFSALAQARDAELANLRAVRDAAEELMASTSPSPFPPSARLRYALRACPSTAEAAEQGVAPETPQRATPAPYDARIDELVDVHRRKIIHRIDEQTAVLTRGAEALERIARAWGKDPPAGSDLADRVADIEERVGRMAGDWR